jgi:hypothetical protein
MSDPIPQSQSGLRDALGRLLVVGRKVTPSTTLHSVDPDHGLDTAHDLDGTGQQTISASETNHNLVLKKSEFGMNALGNVEITPDLREKYEEILEVFASQMIEFRDLGGGKLSDTQEQFLEIWEHKKDTLLDSANGWAFAQTIIEQETMIRMVKLQRDIVLDIKRHCPDATDLTLTRHQLNGILSPRNKKILAIIGVTTTFPISLPVIGVAKLLNARWRDQSVKINLKDWAEADISKLPPEIQAYMKYIDPALDQHGAESFLLKDVIGARDEFYQALGVNLADLQTATPWEKFRPVEAQIVNANQAREDIAVQWMRLRDQKVEEIITAGTAPPGVGGNLNLTDQGHLTWVMYEAQRQTIEAFSKKYLTEIARNQANTPKAIETLQQRIAEASQSTTGEKVKAKKLAETQGKIDKLKGKEASGSIPAVKGEIAEHEEKIEALKAQRKQGEVTHAKTIYEEAQLAVNTVERSLQVLTQQRGGLVTEVQRIANRYDQQIQSIQGTQTYANELALYQAAVLAQVPTADEVAKQFSSEEKALRENWQRARTGRNANVQDLDAQFNQDLLSLNSRRAAAVLTANATWIPLQSFLKKQEEIKTLQAQKKLSIEAVEKRIEALDIKVSEQQADLAGKIATRDAKKTTYQDIRRQEVALERKISSAEAALRRRHQSLIQLQTTLAKQEGTDPESFMKKEQRKIRIWEATLNALRRYDEIIDDIRSPGIAHAKQLEPTDLLSTRQLTEVRGRYSEGYLRILDHLFQYQSATNRSEMFRTAMQCLPSAELAKLLHDHFGLSLPPLQQRQINTVFKAIIGPPIPDQGQMAEVMVEILSHIKQKGLKIE